MRTPLVLLRFVAKAALRAAGAGLLGDFFVDVLPAVAQDVWDHWSRASSEAERQEEIRQIAMASPAELRQATEQVAAEVAGDNPEQVRRDLTKFLTQIQPVVRRTLRRPSDPTGTSVPAGFSIRSARDVIRLLPDRPARFHMGDRPIPGVDWELVELLGMGGFGEVWKARNPHVPNAPPVALKFCLDESAARALRHEAAIDNRLIALHPPGIVRLLHTYLSHDPPCLEYEFVEGGDLAGLLAEWHAAKGLIEAEQAARIVLSLSQILALVHRQEPPIVHRDLKPANILVERTAAGELNFRITDFGIGGLAASQQIHEAARGVSAGAFSMASLRGSHTPLYASPEQTRGGAPDPRDDVHALGVIWYQAFTGELDSGAPTGLDWPDELRARGMNDAQIKLLGACFSRAERRPADAGQLAEAIQRLLLGSEARVEPQREAEPAETAGPRQAPPISVQAARQGRVPSEDARGSPTSAEAPAGRPSKPSSHTWRIPINVVAIAVCLLILAALLLPAIQATREAARRTQCNDNLKNLGLGLQNYHDTYKVFPMGAMHAGFRDPTSGTPVLGPSWQYGILPFMEQRNIYDKIANTIRPGGAVDVAQTANAFSAQVMNEAIEPIGSRPLDKLVPEYMRCPSSPLPAMASPFGTVCLPSYTGVCGGVDIVPDETTLFPRPGDWGSPTSTRTYLNRAGVTVTMAGRSELCRPPQATGTVITSSGMLPVGEQLGMQHCTDGTSNTMIVGEQSDWLRDVNSQVTWRYHGDSGWNGADDGGSGSGSDGMGGFLSGTTCAVPINTQDWRISTVAGPPAWPSNPMIFNLTTVRYKPNVKQVIGSMAEGAVTASAPGCGEIMGLNNPLQSAHPDGLLVAFVDGSVQFITSTTDLGVLLRIAIRDDGQNVRLD